MFQANRLDPATIVLLFLVLILSAPARSWATAPDKAAQKCINGLVRDGQKVSHTVAGELAKCVSSAIKGVELDPLGCAVRDNRGKIAKATRKTLETEVETCPVVPTFGVATGDEINQAATRLGRNLILELFGSDLAGSLRADEEGKCQHLVLRMAQKLSAATAKLFGTCLKNELKAGTLSDVGDIESECLQAVVDDPRLKLAKLEAKVRKVLDRKCLGFETEILFPGLCSRSSDLVSCLSAGSRCQLCLSANEAHGLQADCEVFDDGAANDSCPTCGAGAAALGQVGRCSILSASVVAVDASLHEGGLESGLLRVSLSAVQPRDTEITFTLGGSAGIGVDYELLAGGTLLTNPLIIPAGVQSVDIEVDPLRTPALEGEESIVFSLEAASGFEVDGDSATLSVVEYGPSLGAVYFVDGNGDDGNLGDEASPFATIGYAVSQLTAGDTLYIKDGVYRNTGFAEAHGIDGNVSVNNGLVARLTASGTADNWITIAAYPDGNDVRPLLQFDGLGGIQIGSGANYVRIEGLEIQGPNQEIKYEWAHEHRWSKENFYTGRGIYSWGPVHHIVIENCDVHHTPASGIRFNKADYILVQGNTVSNTTWWSTSAESAIVIATALSIDTEDAVKFLYSGNVVYNNWNFMEFCSSPLESSTADAYGNCDYYTGGIIDGQGLYVTRNNTTYQYGRMRFENNIAFNNGFGGVVYHKTDRGELVNNLVFQNGAYPGTSNYTGMTVNTADDLLIANNVIWARDGNDYGLKNNGNASNVLTTNNYVVGLSQFGTAQDNEFIAFSQADALGDLFENVFDISVARPDPHATSGEFAPANIDALVQAYALDFHLLRSASDLIDTGNAASAPSADFDHVVRPQGGGVDLGPFELEQ